MLNPSSRKKVLASKATYGARLNIKTYARIQIHHNAFLVAAHLQTLGRFFLTSHLAPSAQRYLLKTCICFVLSLDAVTVYYTKNLQITICCYVVLQAEI